MSDARMTPLPADLDRAGCVAWRLDRKVHAATWAGGEGAYLAGGRWNRRGQRVIYAALDPATAILEVAVHRGFAALDTVPHGLTRFRLAGIAPFVLRPSDVPNPNWLTAAPASAGQRGFGSDLLDRHGAAVVPSVVSRYSWNLILLAEAVAAHLHDVGQEPFALDPRLHPPPEVDPTRSGA